MRSGGGEKFNLDALAADVRFACERARKGVHVGHKLFC
jgi:hypothetical protein